MAHRDFSIDHTRPLRRWWKLPIKPTPPIGREVIGHDARAISVEIEADRQQDWASHRHCKEMCDAGHWLFEPQLQPWPLWRADDFYEAAQLWYPGGGREACTGACVGQSEWTDQAVPGIVVFGHRGKRHDRGRLPTKVLQIEPQVLEECDPAVAVALELAIPIVRFREPAVHDPDHTSAAVLGFDGPFGGHRPRSFL